MCSTDYDASNSDDNDDVMNNDDDVNYINDLAVLLTNTLRGTY